MNIIIPKRGEQFQFLQDVFFDKAFFDNLNRYYSNYFDRKYQDDIFIPKGTIITFGTINSNRDNIKINIPIKYNKKAPKEITGLYFYISCTDLEKLDLERV